MALAKPDVPHKTDENGSHTLSFEHKPMIKTPLKGPIIFGVYDPTLYNAIDFVSNADLKISAQALSIVSATASNPIPKKSLPRSWLSVVA